MTLKRTALAAIVMATAAQAQDAAPPSARPTRRPPVVRVGVDLVQLDVVVTDGKGRHVTDLTLDDFEILQDKKPQKPTHARYVVADSAPAASFDRTPESTRRPGMDAPPLAPPAIRPEDVRRVIALVVDDHSLCLVGMYAARQALEQFIRQERREGDLLAVIRTGGGMGVLQQFTNDPRVLQAAIEDLRYSPMLQACGSSVGSLGNLDYEYDRYVNFWNAGATLTAMHGLLDVIRDLPGRKSVVLLSERLTLVDRLGETNAYVLDNLRRLVDAANRASVVFYAIDPGGLRTFAFSAAESGFPTARTDPRVGAISTIGANPISDRSMRLFRDQGGLDELTRSTGGVFHASANRPEAALREVIHDQRGYYLLGYEPEASTFARRDGRAPFHNVKVRVKRPGLKVRTRRGFVGIPDEERDRREPTAGESLLRTVTSPFATSDVPVRLSTLFGHDPNEGYVVDMFLHVDASRLTFQDAEVDGKPVKQAKLQLASTSLRADGMTSLGKNDNLEFVVAPDRLETARRAGLVVRFRSRVDQPGSYQFRVALRDTGSGQAGAATQFVEVPDLGKKRLALSGVAVGTVARPPRTAGSSEAGIDLTAVAESDASPGVRRFRPGAEVSYAFAVYNPRLDRKTGAPDLETVLRIVRERDEVLKQRLDQAQPFAKIVSGSTSRRDKKVKNVPGVVVGGTFRLPPSLPPGAYALQMLVTDRLSNDKKWMTTGQWTAFEVVGDLRADAR